ncbi:hypothetical protein AN958_09787 [Leucoagaricus sp. SymC.cos]|nr:hypothetical protein AN958_09787 [Leucoagaricus sp. SymC.cos]
METQSPPVSDNLPEENNMEINFKVPELEDALADAPVEHEQATLIADIENPAESEEEGGNFMLQAWA